MPVKYTCPKCDAVLKLNNPVPAGKKLRCPECETVFSPPEVPAHKEAASPMAGGRDQGDEEGYGVVQERDTEEEIKRRKVNFTENIRDKYPKSNRGPAIAKCVKPANMLILLAMIVGLGAIVFAIYSIFPLVFNEGIPVTPEKARSCYINLAMAVGIFLYACLVSLGASKMQNLDSYAWAMTGAVLGSFLLLGLPAVITLRDPVVRKGFAEPPVSK